MFDQSGNLRIGRVAGGVFGFIVAIVLVVMFFAWVAAFHGTDPGDVCIVKQGGPFDGRSFKEVRQGGEGLSNIGIWNHQWCYPATQRNYIVSSNPNQGDAKTVDFVEVPTKDAQTVRVNGQALFQMNTDPVVVRDFFKKYGIRTFNGKHLYDGNSGWENFLAIQFRPVLDNALREAIGDFNCTELNNTCQYVTNAGEAVRGNVQQVNTGQNLAAVQDKIQTTLQQDLDSTLGGHYFTNVRWRFSGAGGGAIALTDQIQREVEAAQAKQTQVATARLDAQRRVQKAVGDTQVAQQQARQIQLKAQAYSRNPQQAEIDKLKALCGENGCSNLQVLGSSATKILK